MLTNNIIVFFHIATIGNYQEIFDEIFNSFSNSNLLNKCHKINLCVVGGGELVFKNNENISLYRNPNIDFGEFFTLSKVKNYCDNISTNDKILYLHTKGVTSPNNQCISDWRRYMTYFNVEKHIDSIIFLDEFDTCGVDFVEYPVNHYSGNFWWANSGYIKKLPKIEEISLQNSNKILTLRHNAEFWIGMGKGKHKSIHNSNINVFERHLVTYGEKNYII